MNYDALSFALALLVAIAGGVGFLIKLVLSYERSQLKTNNVLRGLIAAMNEKHSELKKTDEDLREEIEELRKEVRRQEKEIGYLKRIISEVFPDKFKRAEDIWQIEP